MSLVKSIGLTSASDKKKLAQSIVISAHWKEIP